MKKVTILNKNTEPFVVAQNNVASVLETVDELLHDRGLELIIGDDGNNGHHLRIGQTTVDEEYDNIKTQCILHHHNGNKWEDRSFRIGQNMPIVISHTTIQDIIETLMIEAKVEGEVISFESLYKAFTRGFIR